MLKQELSIRKNKLPPFIRLVAIIISSKDRSLSLNGAREIKDKIEKINGLEVLDRSTHYYLKLKKVSN